MAGFCENFSTLNIDLMRQFLAKMARRIEKLSIVKSEYIDEWFHLDVVHKTKKTISDIRYRIDDQINDLQRVFNQMAELKPLDGLDFSTDVYHQVEKLQEYLGQRKN